MCTIFLDRKNTSHIGQGDVRLVLSPVLQETRYLSIALLIPLGIHEKSTIPSSIKMINGHLV